MANNWEFLCRIFDHLWIPGYSVPGQTRMFNPGKYPQTHWYCVRCDERYKLDKKTLYRPKRFGDPIDYESEEYREGWLHGGCWLAGGSMSDDELEAEFKKFMQDRENNLDFMEHTRHPSV